MPTKYGGTITRVRGRSGRSITFGIALAVFLMAIVVGVGIRPRRAAGDEVAEPTATLGATAAQTKDVLEAAGPDRAPEPAETDPAVAEELPHRDLGREEALELVEGVFAAQLEEPAGIYDDLEVTRFLSDNAAVVPSASLPEMVGGEDAPGGAELPPEGSVMIESALPLRAEDEQGETDAVDLELQGTEGPGGTLEPTNPLVEVQLPAQLGEGVTLPGPEVGIAVEGAPQDQTPSEVEDRYAFYPNVAKDTDLAVAPTPTGVELMTDVRSAEAPLATTYELSLPQGAELVSGPRGSAEVVQGGKTIATVAPPTATDAAGESVAATQRVEGSSLTVSISPAASSSFPILVDPEFIGDGWDWTYGHQTMAAWTPSSNDPGLANIPYAFWETQLSPPNPTPAPGLDNTSAGWGNGYVGGQAQWVYAVPRYNEDYAHGYPPPTTWIYQLWTENVWFLTHGNAGDYPAMVLGLADPGSAGWWAPNDTVWYGSHGDFAGAQFGFTNYSDHATKAADFDFVTYENEYPAKYRDSYIGHAAVAVVDEDAPRILGLTAPGGWLTGSSAAIQYSFEDTGLGVRSAGVRLPGESSFRQGGVYFNCVGTAESPCPRKASSEESGRPALTFVPSEYPTGEDTLEVMVGDPLWTLPHVAAQDVAVKIDNTAPEVALSGPLTEQESLGTLQSEYPLTIKATDGTEVDPQSGVARVEVKVDGKTEQTWNPGCASKNCSFSGNWTLKTSEYTAQSHEVEVLVTDAAGVVSENTIEVDLGEAPPQTSFTSPHPSHETNELKTISFKATRGGAPVEGATFRCSLDGAAASPCTSPFPLPEHFEQGLQTFTVAAVDEGGKADPTPATWRFETNPYPPAPLAGEKLVFPETGEQTASYYTLEAEWGANPEGKAGEGVTGVTFQVFVPGQKRNESGERIVREGKFVPNTFETVPAECTIDGQGRQVSWPLPVHTHPGHSAPVYLKVRGCPLFEHAGYPEKEIQFRAVFDGSKAVAGASAPATTEFVSRANANRVATDATETVGPASVDLLTGAFTVSHTDVSIPVPGYEANLEFSRTYSSTVDRSLKGYSMILGGAWQPGSPLESESEGQAWSRIVKQVINEHAAVFADECWEENDELTEQEELEKGFHEGFRIIGCPNPEHCTIEMCEEWEEEPFQPHEEWIELLDTEGATVIFEITPAGAFVAPEYAKELKLTAGTEGTLVLAYPNGSRNIFVPGAANEWNPKYVSFQATPSSMRLVYVTPILEQPKLVREIAPSPVSCEAFESEKTPGCRTLKFEYQKFSIPGHYFGANEKLSSIEYYGPSGENIGVPVAEYQYEVKKTTGSPCYGGTCYEQEAMLVAEMDPRDSAREWYAYDETPGYGKLLRWADREGQEPWGFEYEYGSPAGYLNAAGLSHLKAVTRAGEKTTLAYGVPTHGPAAPYAMGYEDISKWGQADLPVDATAIFPPNHVPAEYPPHEYTGATIHYMDPEGYEVNTASPSPPGVSGSSIATTETDVHGNIVRELDPQNRLVALGSADPAARSHELDTHSVYNAKGTEMLESWGPLHEVRLESGELVQARQHTVTRYDEGAPAPPAGTPPAYLPTKETVAAVVPGKGGEFEPRVTLTSYEWKHRLPEETVVDPGGLDIRSVTKYNAAGQVEETRQPKGAAGGTAGDTKTIYYSATTAQGECPASQRYVNLPCEVLPTAQASGTGRKQLDVKKFLSYNDLGEPEQVTEYPQDAPAESRTTITEYDEAGRQEWAKILGGGTELARTEAKTETIYSPETGMPTEQRFVCEASNCTGFDNQAVKTTYNKLGQVTGYEDADGNKAETTYDAYGRPATITDGKGSETLHYDEASGLVTSMEVSGVGTFTAAYDADGDLIQRGLPNGLTAKTTYNQADEPMALAYVKSTSTWYEESLERSIEGRILNGTSSLVEDRYSYDKAGRLTEAQETPAEGLPEEGICTSREYTYDADSNRLTKTTLPPGVGGACATSGGNTESYSYDEADRLIGPTYDAWGRITSLPAEYAGGKELKTSYFADDMVATQEQNAVTNTFQLDATGRQRQREQTGGVAGVEIFHYDGPGDSPSWTSLGSTWSRSIVGFGGELVAIQEGGGGTTTTTFKLTDLHGDVVATASSSPTATELLSTSRYDEFGEPVSGETGARYGWLGGKSRRTELPSGVIQMGARSYIPQLGRFLTPDPLRGGSANPYDYADQDPINNFDLGGEKCSNGQRPGHKKCLGPPTPKRLRSRERHTASRLARKTPNRTSIIIRCRTCGMAATASSLGSAFESVVNKVSGAVKGAASSVYSSGGEVWAKITAPSEAFQAAGEAFKLANDWSPTRLIQAWKCGTWLGGGPGTVGDCDPVAIMFGEPESAR